MKISIIGKVNAELTYEDWVSMLQTNVEVEFGTQINITDGNGILNQYVRKYAGSHNLIVKEFAPDFIAYGDEAKKHRNVAIVDNADLIVGFLPEALSKKTGIFQQGLLCDKKAIVICCQNSRSNNQMKIKNVIVRVPSNKVVNFSPNELISVEDEAELVRTIRQGEGDVDAAKKKLMRVTHRFVRSVAQKYISPNITLEELMAEGQKGLEVAIAKFDESRGFKFSTYAVWWIRQNIQQYVKEKKN